MNNPPRESPDRIPLPNPLFLLADPPRMPAQATMSTTKITSTQPAPTDFFQKPQGKGFTIDFEQQVSPEFPPASS